LLFRYYNQDSDDLSPDLLSKIVVKQIDAVGGMVYDALAKGVGIEAKLCDLLDEARSSLIVRSYRGVHEGISIIEEAD